MLKLHFLDKRKVNETALLLKLQTVCSNSIIATENSCFLFDQTSHRLASSA